MPVQGRNGKTIVMSPFVGSPAYKAGLKPGDVIVEVNGKPTDNLDSTKVADMLKGPKGTPVADQGRARRHRPADGFQHHSR